MNVKKGDLAVVRTTHPMQEMHGTLVNVVAFMGSVDHVGTSIENVWHVDLLGQKRAADDGQLVSWGYIEDRFLFAIGGAQDVKTERGSDFIEHMRALWRGLKREQHGTGS